MGTGLDVLNHLEIRMLYKHYIFLALSLKRLNLVQVSAARRLHRTFFCAKNNSDLPPISIQDLKPPEVTAHAHSSVNKIPHVDEPRFLSSSEKIWINRCKIHRNLAVVCAALRGR